MKTFAFDLTRGNRLRAFYVLTKPRVNTLIVFCAVIGMFLAVPEGLPNAFTVFAATVGIACVAGAAWTGAQGGSGVVEAMRVKVVSAHGAGDTFVGHLVAALVRGDQLGAAVSRANGEAARYVSTVRQA